MQYKILNGAVSYDGDMVLENVDIEINDREKIAIIGRNGSGKTTLLKLVAGLLTSNTGMIQVCGQPVGPETKSLVSYLPDRTYLRSNQKIKDQMDFFQDFYADFDRPRAEDMLQKLGISPEQRFGTLSKGNREKVQLVLVMSRRAKLYLLDEPIGGVDPAARDYILSTIIGSYNPEAAVIITTHLIYDIEPVLDEYIFVNYGGKIIGTDFEAIEKAENRDAFEKNCRQSLEKIKLQQKAVTDIVKNINK